MNNRLLDAMSEAGQLVQSGHLGEATTVIRQAMGKLAGLAPSTADDPMTIDGDFREVGVAPSTSRPAESPARELFEEIVFHDGALTGRYKVFVPAGLEDRAVPLVVLLHGCTQTPDDFAAGTDMNRLARERGFVVLYPAQSTAANASSCWNWFRPGDQVRDQGEPALIVGMTREVVSRFRIDPRRVYVAGLSAGGAMAAIVASEYPELFAAMGVHSGLAPGAARNIPDALTTMRTGKAKGGAATAVPRAFVPAIVFHGDADRTVHPDNGDRVVRAVLAAAGAGVVSKPVVTEDTSASGRRYRRTVHAAASGESLVEHWLVHGEAHAWAGGDVRGSHTDPQGPSASAEMLRFFDEHPRRDPRG